MAGKIVTLTTFMYPVEAYPLMMRLKQEGIECFLGDENIITALPFLSNAVGGIKVNINDKDLDKALLVLQEMKD